MRARAGARGSGRTPVERLRAICLALPEATEKIAWGEPTWRVRGKLFAQLDDHHHGADHLAVWLPAPLGEQEAMIFADPVRFFRPPYVGPRGWVGVRIDRRPNWTQVATLVEQAYRQVAPPAEARRRTVAELARSVGADAAAVAREEQEDLLMLTPETIEATAHAAFDTYRMRARYRPLDAALRRAPLDDAYRIQDALHRVMAAAGRGEIAGWKIALTSKAMQQMTGVDQPAAGAIFSKVVHPSPARVDVAAYHHVGVEFEVAVRLGDALPASGGPWTRASVAGKVAACIPAFELIEDGGADYKTLDAFTLIAQNTWNGGVVIGPAVTEWRRVDLEHAVTRCWVNDQPAGQGKTGDAMGHPFEALAWLANLLNSQGRRLEPGMIVMTGSSITTKFPAPGDRVRFAIDGLGEVALEAAR